MQEVKGSLDGLEEKSTVHRLARPSEPQVRQSRWLAALVLSILAGDWW